MINGWGKGWSLDGDRLFFLGIARVSDLSAQRMMLKIKPLSLGVVENKMGKNFVELIIIYIFANRNKNNLRFTAYEKETIRDTSV